MRNFEPALSESKTKFESFDGLFYTPKQLFYELCRTQKSPLGIKPKNAAALFVLSALGAFAVYRETPKTIFKILAASGAGLGFLAAVRRTPHTLKTPISQEVFERNLEEKNNPTLLNPAEKTDFEILEADDLTLYGLPKVLVCESEMVARMLRKNQFHLQTSCAVLSLNEATPLDENFKKMLERAESPQVFFLHDADLKSLALIKTLRQKLELDEKILLRPIGLRPVHAQRLHLFSIKKSEAKDFDFSDFDYLSDAEKRWLAEGNSAKVEAVSPVRLLRVLRRIVSNAQTPQNEAALILPNKHLGFM